ncbi:unnamed protein product [Amoebophrya sp. A120]|nr:unnamed protein product [Amoebophrya sp. A120]|eukprot:GSA120T00016359001.1
MFSPHDLFLMWQKNMQELLLGSTSTHNDLHDNQNKIADMIAGLDPVTLMGYAAVLVWLFFLPYVLAELAKSCNNYSTGAGSTSFNGSSYTAADNDRVQAGGVMNHPPAATVGGGRAGEDQIIDAHDFMSEWRSSGPAGTRAVVHGFFTSLAGARSSTSGGGTTRGTAAGSSSAEQAAPHRTTEVVVTAAEIDQRLEELLNKRTSLQEARRTTAGGITSTTTGSTTSVITTCGATSGRNATATSSADEAAVTTLVPEGIENYDDHELNDSAAPTRSCTVPSTSTTTSSRPTTTLAHTSANNVVAFQEPSRHLAATASGGELPSSSSTTVATSTFTAVTNATVNSVSSSTAHTENNSTMGATSTTAANPHVVVPALISTGGAVSASPAAQDPNLAPGASNSTATAAMPMTTTSTAPAEAEGVPPAIAPHSAAQHDELQGSSTTTTSPEEQPSSPAAAPPVELHQERQGQLQHEDLNSSTTTTGNIDEHNNSSLQGAGLPLQRGEERQEDLQPPTATTTTSGGVAVVPPNGIATSSNHSGSITSSRRSTLSACSTLSAQQAQHQKNLSFNRKKQVERLEELSEQFEAKMCNRELERNFYHDACEDEEDQKALPRGPQLCGGGAGGSRSSRANRNYIMNPGSAGSSPFFNAAAGYNSNSLSSTAFGASISDVVDVDGSYPPLTLAAASTYQYSTRRRSFRQSSSSAMAAVASDEQNGGRRSGEDRAQPLSAQQDENSSSSSSSCRHNGRNKSSSSTRNRRRRGSTSNSFGEAGAVETTNIITTDDEVVTLTSNGALVRAFNGKNNRGKNIPKNGKRGNKRSAGRKKKSGSKNTTLFSAKNYYTRSDLSHYLGEHTDNGFRDPMLDYNHAYKTTGSALVASTSIGAVVSGAGGATSTSAASSGGYDIEMKNDTATSPTSEVDTSTTGEEDDDSEDNFCDEIHDDQQAQENNKAAVGKCVICMDSIATELFTNCRHLALCSECALDLDIHDLRKAKQPGKSLQPTKCPVCRTTGPRVQVFHC